MSRSEGAGRVTRPGRSESAGVLLVSEARLFGRREGERILEPVSLLVLPFFEIPRTLSSGAAFSQILSSFEDNVG